MGCIAGGADRSQGILPCLLSVIAVPFKIAAIDVWPAWVCIALENPTSPVTPQPDKNQSRTNRHCRLFQGRVFAGLAAAPWRLDLLQQHGRRAR